MWERLLRCWMAALGVGLAWGIRGDFGHALGAMFPGAMLGLGFVLAASPANAVRWLPVLGAAGALGISLGGHMSYGLLHGYAKADTFINYAYGFFTLLLQGGAWGCFGGVLIGLLLEPQPLPWHEWLSGLAVVVVGGTAFYLIVHDGIGFDINPGRSNLSVGYTGGVLSLFAWLVGRKRSVGLRGAFFGYLGFGLGMAGGRLLANASYHLPWAVNHWNIGEVMCGFIGGFIFAWGMLDVRFPDRPEARLARGVEIAGLIYVLALIPCLHRWLRIDAAAKLEAWQQQLQRWGVSQPADTATLVLHGLNAVCVAAVAAAALWGWLYARGYRRWVCLPWFMLGLLMLLVQNLNALFFWRPHQPATINMHFVFWILYGWMAVTAWWVRPDRPRTAPATLPPLPWKSWLGGAAVAMLVILGLSAVINGPKTMRSANMRWPLWSWREGPPPQPR